MRVEEKKLNFIMYMTYISIIIIATIVQIKMIYSDKFIIPTVISKAGFEFAYSLIISLFSFLIIIRKVTKYRKIKNQTLDIYIDTKATKKRSLYLILGLDMFLILLIIGLESILGIIILINAIIWNVLIILWVRFDDGFYGNYLFYIGAVYHIEQIETCLIAEDEIELIVLDRVLFLEIIRHIKLSSKREESRKVISLLSSTKVISANTISGTDVRKSD